MNMPGIEELLREELKRVADTAQPGQLRPLRVPAERAHRLRPLARGSRWQSRLLPVATGAAVIAIVIVASLLATMASSGRRPAPQPTRASAAMPRYYVTVARSGTGLTAVVRGSADGHVTGTVAVPDTRGAQDWSVTAEADDRHFVIAAYLSMAILPGNAVFFGLPVSADGRPGQPERLRVALQGGLLTGMALSADGTMLALSQKYPVPLVMEPVYYGGIEVIDLATGKTRTWTGRGAEGYWPGTPSWANGDRTLTFTWWHSTSLATAAADLVGIRELDTSAPGSNLLASRLVTFRAVTHGLQSAVITSGGREIIASSCGDADGYHGTAVARVVELSAADGHLLRLLWHQDVRFPNATDEMDAIVSACTLLSADPSGDHVLVQALRFGRIDNGVFTVLPGASPRVLFVAAAW